MTPELDNRMTFILSSHLIFRQIDCINEAEWLEELTDFQISKTTKRIYKPTHIYTVVLLAPRMVVLRRKRVHFLRHAILIIVTVFLKLGGCGLSIFFSLRSLHHKCLSIQLLSAHGHGHQHRLRRIKLYIGNPNTQKGKFKQGGLIWNEKSTRCRVNLVLTKSNSAVNQSYIVTEKCLQFYWFLSGESNSQQLYTQAQFVCKQSLRFFAMLKLSKFYLPFWFARARVSNHSHISDLSYLRQAEELEKHFLVHVQVDPTNKNCTVISLRFFCLSLCLFQTLLQQLLSPSYFLTPTRLLFTLTASAAVFPYLLPGAGRPRRRARMSTGFTRLVLVFITTMVLTVFFVVL